MTAWVTPLPSQPLQAVPCSLSFVTSAALALGKVSPLCKVVAVTSLPQPPLVTREGW